MDIDRLPWSTLETTLTTFSESGQGRKGRSGLPCAMRSAALVRNCPKKASACGIDTDNRPRTYGAIEKFRGGKMLFRRDDAHDRGCLLRIGRWVANIFDVIGYTGA